MKETVALLVMAHLLADFLFQTNWMVQKKRNFFVLILHLIIVTVTAGLAVGHWNHPLIWIIAASHLAIDSAKTYLLPDRLWTFLADQALHLVAIFVGAYYFPDCAQTGLWFQLIQDPTSRNLFMKAVIVVAGIILCIQTGGVLVAKTIQSIISDKLLENMKGIPNGGRLIGYLERTFVMLLIWINQADGIGFLVAAKSILRFRDINTSEDREITEYVIIGTLLSFGWAIFVSALMQRILDLW